MKRYGASRNLNFIYFDLISKEIGRKKSLNDSGGPLIINDDKLQNLSLIKTNASSLIERDISLPPKYAEKFDICNDLLKELEIKYNRLVNFQQRRLVIKFDEDENKQLNNNINNLCVQMTDKIKELEKNIKELKIETVEDKINEQIKNNMQILICNKLSEFSKKFKFNQEEYIKKYKDLVGEELINSSFSFNKTNDSLKKENFLMTDNENNILQKRDEALTRLLSSATELSQVYKDLQNLVMEQGSILDRIDYNIEEASINVDKGKKNIKKAESYQKKNCYRNAVMILIVTIFIECVLLIFKIF